MLLTYEAIDTKGRPTTDTIEASNATEARETLRDRGLYVTRVSEKTGPRAARGDTRPRTRTNVHVSTSAALPLKTLMLFTRQMAMLLRAGSGIVPSCAAIKRQMHKPQQAALLENVVACLEEGMSLTDALRRWPKTFDPVYCAIIAAGESSGKLTEMFERLSDMVGSRRAMRNKVVGALTYPALLILMSTGILLVLFFFVLPRFAQMFTQLGVEAPASTQALLATGAFLRGYWHAVLGTVAAVVTATVLFVRSGSGKQWFSDAQLEIPLLGRVRSRLIQAQIFRTMGTLLCSKVGVLDSLDLAKQASRCTKFQRLFDRLEETVTSGGQPSSVFEESKIVEPYICQALRTGEESGSIGEAMNYCADLLDETNTELVTAVTRLIEPLILIVMGAFVGGVAISLFMPLFDLTSAMR